MVYAADAETKSYDPDLAALLADLAEIAANECGRHRAERTLARISSEAEAARADDGRLRPGRAGGPVHDRRRPRP